MKQLTLNLTFAVAPAVKSIFKNTTWLNAGWATACLGFTKKVEISGRFIAASLRLHVEEKEQLILLGLIQDF